MTEHPGTTAVFSLPSLRDRALLDLSYPNGTHELVLYNGRFKTSTVVHPYVPGGATVTPVSMIAAGGALYLAWNNFSVGVTYFERVGFNGSAAPVSLPLGPSFQWSFAYSNTSRLFATTLTPFGSFLVELNATTGSMVAN